MCFSESVWGAPGVTIEKLKLLGFGPDEFGALQAAMGRGTVPVLRIDEAGSTRWIPESADIVAYLYSEHGEGKAPAFLASNWPQRVGFGLALALAAAAVATGHPELGIAAAAIWLLGNRAPLLRRWF